MKKHSIDQRPKLLVSACLLGCPCRYDGNSKPCQQVIALRNHYDLVPVCPEKLGDLETPRTPSEQRWEGKVLRVVSSDGEDRTQAFYMGASKAVDLALEHGCTVAILKAKSPSCGVGLVYDGSFSGKLVAGMGIAAGALRDAGVIVFTEDDVVDALAYVQDDVVDSRL